MDPEAITIKGIRQGLLVTLPQSQASEDWQTELSTLGKRLGANPAFFRGGRVALEVGSRELSHSDLEQARARDVNEVPERVEVGEGLQPGGHGVDG